jgi:hypothetical protein
MLVESLSAPVALIFIAVLGGVLLVWAAFMKRSVPRDVDPGAHVAGRMMGAGRWLFGAMGVFCLVAGSVARSAIAVLGGLLLLASAVGQHWSRRRISR